jgi:tryptophan synthase alpha chain
MRISQTFLQLKQQSKPAFVAYLCAGDPSYQATLTTMLAMPKLGVNIIEVGMPFLDPSGDGPIIEMASKRAVQSGATLAKTLNLIADFRQQNQSTPIVLMSYFNPILKYGLEQVFFDIKKAGADGVLIVDSPLEEQNEILDFIKLAQLDFINLISPATPINRAKQILQNTSGFAYLISLAGITGTKQAKASNNVLQIEQLKQITNLPIVVGFGIKNSMQAQEFANIGADGIVVGSALVEKIAQLPSDCQNLTPEISNFISEINSAISIIE